MMITLLTLAVLAASAFLVLGGLRMVANDTFQTVANAAHRARINGELLPRLSFVALWVLIFALSYM